MSQQPSIDSQGLEDAFHTFNQLSIQLTESYKVLEKRVADLNLELATARDDRFRELTEKERLANRLELLLNVLPGGVVVIDGQGLIHEYNPAAIELIGEPLLGESWPDVIQRAFAPRSDDGHEVSLVDGRRVSINTCPLGKEPGQILLITDVTEMRLLQDSLNQQQRLAAMGETAASLAHQIRTPLSSALLYTSNLKRQYMDTGERKRVGEKIASRLCHLEQLVNNMLMYARGKKVGEEAFTVKDLLNDLAQSLEAQIKATHTLFEVRDTTHGRMIYGNRQMLLSGLINLAVNAIQAMDEKGHLQVIANMTEIDTLEILIIDNGAGIEVDKQQDIFSPFYTTRKEGTGLGLAVVEAIMRAHNGRVSLESEPGKGSCFILVLPLNKGLRQLDYENKLTSATEKQIA